MSNIGQLFPTNSFIIAGATKGASDVAASYTRPGDVTAYDTNDALSNSVSAPTALVFANVGRIEGASGYLVSATCGTSQIVFAGALRLHLFKGSVAPTAINDNSPYPMLAANNAQRIGYIDFSAFASGGTGSDTAISFGIFPQSRLIPFSCDAANSNLYGLVGVRTGFTPIASQAFSFYLGVEQN